MKKEGRKDEKRKEARHLTRESCMSHGNVCGGGGLRSWSWSRSWRGMSDEDPLGACFSVCF